MQQLIVSFIGKTAVFISVNGYFSPSQKSTKPTLAEAV
jgi:hypothetical protein